MAMSKTVPGNPSAKKPDMGPMKKPPMGKPMAKVMSKGKPMGNGKRAA